MPTKHIDEDGNEYAEVLAEEDRDKNKNDSNNNLEESEELEQEKDPIGKSTKKRTFRGRKPRVGNADIWYTACGTCLTIWCCSLCLNGSD